MRRRIKSSHLEEVTITTRSGILFSVTHGGNIVLTHDGSQRAVGGRSPALMGLLSGGRPDGRRDGSRRFYGE